MAAWFDLFSRSSSNQSSMPEVFPMSLLQKDFVTIDMEALYSRILTDVFDRTHGLPNEAKETLYDNCLASEMSSGLITLISKAISTKSELFLVYNRPTKVIRKATAQEEQQIRADYKQRNESDVGVYITFQNMHQVDMLRFYSMLEYCTVSGLWTMQNLSKALQIKAASLRASVGLPDSKDIEAQALKIAQGLKDGKAVLLDKEDMIETNKPDLTAHDSAMNFINQKKSYYLGLPAAYITGELKGGLGDSGKADSKAIDRGLRPFFFSVVKPVITGLFGASRIDFKSEDSEGLSTALEVLKTMDLTSDEYMGKENKTIIVNKAFGLDIDETGDETEEVPTLPTGQGTIPPRT